MSDSLAKEAYELAQHMVSCGNSPPEKALHEMGEALEDGAQMILRLIDALPAQGKLANDKASFEERLERIAVSFEREYPQYKGGIYRELAIALTEIRKSRERALQALQPLVELAAYFDSAATHMPDTLALNRGLRLSHCREAAVLVAELNSSKT